MLKLNDFGLYCIWFLCWAYPTKMLLDVSDVLHLSGFMQRVDLVRYSLVAYLFSYFQSALVQLERHGNSEPEVPGRQPP